MSKRLSELIEFDQIKKENEILKNKVRRSQDALKAKATLLETKDAELLSTKWMVEERDLKIKMLTEALNQEEVKEDRKQAVQNFILRKLVDLCKRAKTLIDSRNLHIEELKRERAQYLERLEEMTRDKEEWETLPLKRKKPDES